MGDMTSGYSSNALSSVGVGKTTIDPHSHLRQPDPYQMFGPTSSRLASSVSCLMSSRCPLQVFFYAPGAN
ncbi:hypothetical protein DMENIID0001_009640 [Sergentomyia squamirostris]